MPEKDKIFFGILFIFHYIFYPAVEDFAEHFNGMRADTLVPLQPSARWQSSVITPSSCAP